MKLVSQKSLFCVLSGASVLTIIALGCDRQPAEPVTDIVIIREGGTATPVQQQGDTVTKPKPPTDPKLEATPGAQSTAAATPGAQVTASGTPAAPATPDAPATPAPTPDAPATPAATPVATPAAPATPSPTVVPTPATPPVAGMVEYKMVPHADETTGIAFKIGYTFGTHKGVATAGEGTVVIADSATLFLKKAHFAVPIASLKSGNDVRDCHILEAMGIRYEGSSFPAKHVCNGSNLPDSGPDSAVYSGIQFDLLDAAITSANKLLAVDQTISLATEATWAMHGITQKASVPLDVTLLSDGTIHVVGSTNFNIKDYNMVVKPFLGIGVKDIATVELDLIFQKN